LNFILTTYFSEFWRFFILESAYIGNRPFYALVKALEQDLVKALEQDLVKALEQDLAKALYQDLV
jgi:hypothetical protein